VSGTSFEHQLAARPAAVYADFLLPHLDRHSQLLDVGCGDGALAVGLAAVCGRVTAVDLDPQEYAAGAAHAESRGLDRLTFVAGDATRLEFADRTFDAALAHSVLESGPDPALVLAEIRRVLKPGGWIGVACVEYGGLILAGPGSAILHRSNAVRERLWQRSGADPFLGRELRRLLGEAGFVDVEATTKAFSYGTPALVRAFADGRGSECADDDYVAEAVAAGLATEDELAAMATAWSDWGESAASYAAFTWCRAVARRPIDEEGSR
jgi:SAM-dependent methyltransferase